MRGFADPEDAAEAYAALLGHRYTSLYARSLLLASRRPPPAFSLLPPDVLEEVARAALDSLNASRAAVARLAARYASKYSFADFWLSARLPPALAVAMVAHPPQLGLASPRRWVEALASPRDPALLAARLEWRPSHPLLAAMPPARALRAALSAAWLVAVKTAVDNCEARFDEVPPPDGLPRLEPAALSEKYASADWDWLLRLTNRKAF